jgi:DNA-binding NarL/FixJ family response regulator
MSHAMIKVLIADDHALVRDGLGVRVATLEGGARVIEACDWPETLATARDSELDLALVDLHMPGRDGLQALAELSRHHTELRVIVVSASDDLGTMRAALSAGALGYVAKSEPTAVMLAAIRLVLGGGMYVPPALASLCVPTFPRATRGPTLTGRQLDVLRWVMEGKSNQEIADLLQVARATVKVHLAGAFRVLGVINRTQAAVEAARLGLYAAGRSK